MSSTDKHGMVTSRSTGVDIAGVDFSFGRRKTVFRDFSLEIPVGRTVLLGPNGAGKSTLSLLICGLLTPASGSITVTRATGGSSASALRHDVGLMPQDIAPIPGLTVREQVAYAGWLAGLSTRRAQQRADELLEMVGLSAEGKSSAGRISGGQLRRVGLAQALVTDPQFLILDEPTAGLDPAQRLRFRRILESLHIPSGLMVVTHQVDDIASSYDQVVVLNHGSVKFVGTPHQFLALGDDGPEQGDRAYLNLLGEEIS